ncbi:MAG: hypothetical protein P1Q69_11175 [Candidatus Thorarchaeota archaeon]|nr:hypothetical protein [Candidatus Thorarchaeota archaeon]
MGDYKTDELLEKRFGLEALHREGMIPQEMYRDLANTLWSTRFLDLSHNINEVLKEGSDAFDKLCFNISAFLPEMKEGEYIVVLDGWEDFLGMVPGHQQYLVRALEQKLLDTLPQSDINVIWIDGGTHHTRMNIHYQRKCVTPLRYDSPRKTHLDEIIYNLPTPPRQFWWMNPQEEDVRIIVQDTPTQATPWEVAIQVPQLIGFTETFRGLTRRDGIVAPEDVIRDVIKVQSMHGRGVTLSSIALSVEQISTDSLPNLLDHALALVPSVLRQRETAPDDEPKEETLERAPQWHTALQYVSSAGSSTLSDRLGIDVTRPPPRPRGTNRYVDTLSTSKDDGITRPWRYDQTPQQIPDDDNESHPTTYTPLGEDLKITEIDTIKTREHELRRLYCATKYLKDQKYVSKTLRGCCKKIERYCAKQFSLIRENPNLKTSKFFLEALRRVKNIIFEDPQRSDVWNSLLSLREKLPALLNSQNRDLLQDVIDDNSALFTLYGNNLFLAVLVALGTNKASLAEHLWTPIAEWTFYQIGMDTNDDEVRTVYSFQVILSNLRSRIKTLSHLELPEKVSDQSQIGAVIWKESEFGFDALLLIPREDGYITGLISGLRDRWIPPKYHSCKTTPQNLKEFTNEVLLSTDRTPIVITMVQETQVLWVPVMDKDDNLQWFSFSFVHGKPGGRRNSIPWLKLEPTVPLMVPGSVPTIPDSIDETLKKLARVKHRIISVELTVSVNRDLKVFEVELESGSFNEHLEFTRTKELVQFLRTPVHTSPGYRSQQDTLTWDYLKDIDYNDSLSFLKPLVHQSRFFPDEFHVPRTCRELLAATNGDDITMMVRPEGKHFRVEIKDLPRTSPLKRLEKIELGFHSLGLLTECNELYDPLKRTIHSVNLNINAIMGHTSSKIQLYPRLKEALEEADPDEFDWSQDIWRLSAQIRKNKVYWSILSGTTKNAWLRKSFEYVLSEVRSPDDAIKAFKEEIENVIPLSNLGNLDDKLETLESTLRERYQERLAHRNEDDSEMEIEQGNDESIQANMNGFFSYGGVEFKTDNSGSNIVVVNLVTDDDIYIEILICRIQQYLEWMQLAGGVEPTSVDAEISTQLTPYRIRDASIIKIAGDVKNLLMKAGIKFFEQ